MHESNGDKGSGNVGKINSSTFKERLSSPIASQFTSDSQPALTSPVQEVVQLLAQRKLGGIASNSPSGQATPTHHLFSKSIIFNNGGRNAQQNASLYGEDSKSISSTLTMKTKDNQFLSRMNQPENKALFQKSLGEVLKQRREL